MKELKDYQTVPEAEKTLLLRCREALKALDPAAEIILYGSRARGDADRESDYDLLILSDGDASIEREDFFRRRLFPLELETGAVVTVLLVGRKEWKSPLYGAMPFYQNIQRDGVVL